MIQSLFQIIQNPKYGKTFDIIELIISDCK